MILDLILVLIFVISVFAGRKTGLFLLVARFLSLLLATLFTVFLRDPILEVVRSISYYESAAEKLTGIIENAVQNGETALLSPFLSDANMVFDMAAKGILDMIITALLFVLFSILVRIIIRLIDKSVFKLPIIGHVNRFLGMALSFVFTAVLAYLVIGLLGGVAMCSEVTFLREQMENSILVRYMYEHNIVLNLF